jgi:uncharacterized membrane protein YfcA
MVDQLPFVLAILFLAYFIRGAFGFGDALVATSLLSLFLELRDVTPLSGLTGTTATLLMLYSERAHISFRRVAVLILSCCAGIPIGIYLLRGPFDVELKILLGCFILLFSLINLTRPDLFQLRNERLAPLFGFGAGILGGALNTSGPLIVLYGLLRRWERGEMLANYQAFFMASGMIVLSGHALGGLWSLELFKTYAICLPFVLLGLWIGQRLQKHLSDALFRRLIFMLLILVGLTLVVRTVLVAS